MAPMYEYDAQKDEEWGAIAEKATTKEVRSSKKVAQQEEEEESIGSGVFLDDPILYFV